VGQGDAREDAITTLMQVMSYPRERAVEVLRRYHYDLDVVFAHILT
jgi:hypothetical protein